MIYQETQLDGPSQQICNASWKICTNW